MSVIAATPGTWSADIDDSVVAISAAPDGRIAAAGGEGSLTLLSPGGEVMMRRELSPGCLAVDWSPGGDHIAVGSIDGVVMLDDSGVEVVRSRGGWCSSLAWSFDGARLAAGVGRSTVVMSSAGAVLARRDRESTVTGVAWVNRRVATAAYGGVHIFHVSQSATVDVLPFTGSLLALAISPDRRWAASGNQDATLHVWRVGKRGDELQMSGYPTKITAVGFSPDSTLLASGGGHDVTVWSFTGAGPKGSTPRILSVHEEPVTVLAWSADGDLLASAADDGRVAVWRPRSAVPGQPLPPIDMLQRAVPAAAVAWDRIGRLIAGWSDGTVTAHIVAQ